MTEGRGGEGRGGREGGCDVHACVPNCSTARKTKPQRHSATSVAFHSVMVSNVLRAAFGFNNMNTLCRREKGLHIWIKVKEAQHNFVLPITVSICIEIDRCLYVSV